MRGPAIRGSVWAAATALLLAALAGCRTTAPEPLPPAPDQNKGDESVEPMPPAQFTPGPAIAPAGALLTWLNDEARAETEDGERKRLRLPVVVRFKDGHRMAIGEAFVSVADAAADRADRIGLKLEDGAMGISLLDHLRRRCPEGRETCAVWLEGYWGPLVDLGLDEGAPDRWPFAVLQVHDLIAEPMDAGTTVFIQAK